MSKKSTSEINDVQTFELKSSSQTKIAFYVGVLLLGLLMLIAPAAFAQQVPGFIATETGQGKTEYSVSIQTLLMFTALGFIPAAILMTTAFTRIVIVFSLLRMALGTQSSPPNQVIIGLALFMTVFIMKPTLTNIYENAYAPYQAGQIEFSEFGEKAMGPMREFMIKQTRKDDLQAFVEFSGEKAENTADVSTFTLIPAFVISELKTAFQIGFLIFIPFLIIDLVISSVLMSMGMMMLSPMLISLPFKLMLFVMVDGWKMITGSLIGSFIQ